MEKVIGQILVYFNIQCIMNIFKGFFISTVFKLARK